MSRGGGREREDYGPDSAGVRNKVSVLVRNIPLTFTAEDLRAKFEKFGELRDVYIPRDYYTQRSRGFGFIEFRDARDADEAIYQLDKTTVAGRTIEVCLSKEGRKTPRDMMIIESKQGGGGHSGSYGGDDRRDRRRSRSPRRGSRCSRSRSPRRDSRHSRSRSPRGRGGRDYDRDYDRGGRDRDYDRGGRDRDYDRGGRNRDYDRERDRGGRDRDYDRGGRSGGAERERDVDNDHPRGNRSPSTFRDRDRSPPRNVDDLPEREREPDAEQREPRPPQGEEPLGDDY